MAIDMTQFEIVRELFDLTGARWTLPVLVELRAGRHRFGELAREIGGVSQKQLTITLRELERHGFVLRSAFATIPPRVEYELTELGRDLVKTTRELGRFAVQHRPDIEAARARFDERAVD